MRLFFSRIINPLLWTALSLVAACGKPAPSGPVSTNSSSQIEITDGAGRNLELASLPRRIVSLSPAATDILIADGAHAQLVGATRYCTIPAADENHVVRIGGITDPDYERIMTLKPDLVIAPWLADKSLQEKLSALGLAVLVLHPEGLQGVIEDIRLVGKASGHSDEAEAKAKFIENVRALTQARWKDTPPEKHPRVLIFMDDLSPAPGSYVGDLLKAAGARNVLPPGNKAWIEVSPESVLQLSPDIIIEIPSSNQPTNSNGKAVAVKSARNVVLADGEVFYHPGPDLGLALWALAHAIDPGRFPEASPPLTP